jgi:hypothetical protein
VRARVQDLRMRDWRGVRVGNLRVRDRSGSEGWGLEEGEGSERECAVDVRHYILCLLVLADTRAHAHEASLHTEYVLCCLLQYVLLALL